MYMCIIIIVLPCSGPGQKHEIFTGIYINGIFTVFSYY